jgi:antitoxin component of MazEF toxin-antitoxin module
VNTGLLWKCYAGNIHKIFTEGQIMNKTIVSILIAVLSLSAVVTAIATNQRGNTDAYVDLQELYAQNWGVSPDMVLPADFVTSHAQLQELYAQNWGVSPDMVLPADFVSSHAELQELYAQNWGVSPDMVLPADFNNTAMRESSNFDG